MSPRFVGRPFWPPGNCCRNGSLPQVRDHWRLGSLDPTCPQLDRLSLFQSKRDFVVVRLGWDRALGRWCGWPCGRTRSFVASFGGAARGSARPAAEKLHRLANDTQFRSLLATLLIVPSVKLQTPLNKNRPTFFQIFTGDLGETRPQNNIDVGDLLALFPVIERVLPINGYPKIANCAAFRSVSDFRI